MYIKKQLLQEATALHFKYKLTTHKPELNIDTLNDIIDSHIPIDYKEIIIDLIICINDRIPCSILGRSLYNNVMIANTKVNRVINNSGLTEIIDILKSLSDNACIVGGAVRDSIINKAVNDFDFVTDTDYDKLTIAFKSNGYNVKETGKQFLVLDVSKNGNRYEIANYRKDSTYSDGRRPDSVSIGDIYDDAYRRDFYINSLYYSLNKEIIIDPTGQGLKDLLNNTVRFIGKPKDRINEDKLRIIRFYRFVNAGYKADNQSLQACRSQFNYMFKEVSPERVRVEIEKMCFK